MRSYSAEEDSREKKKRSGSWKGLWEAQEVRCPPGGRGLLSWGSTCVTWRLSWTDGLLVFLWREAEGTGAHFLQKSVAEGTLWGLQTQPFGTL